MDYHAMRLAWCRRALLDLLRRWGIYAVITAVLLGAGVAGAGSILAGVAAWAVVPLFHAVASSPLLAVAATLMQAGCGVVVIWALRPLLLPRRWLEAERALPVAPALSRRSDLTLVGIALLPLFALYVAGSASVFGSRPPWLQGHRAAAIVALLLACAGSIGFGAGMLQRRRAPPRRRHARADQAAAAVSGHLRWPRALLWLPLWRGPARRTGGLLATGALALLIAPAGLSRWPQAGGWWLAALALGTLLLSTRLATLVREEIGPLLDAAATLPLDRGNLARRAALLPLAPLLPAVAATLRALPPSRPVVMAVYVAGLFAAAALPSFSPVAQAETVAGRWLLSLVLLLALASEVLP